MWLKRGEKMLSIDIWMSANGLSVRKLLQKNDKKSTFFAEFRKIINFNRKKVLNDRNDIFL
jgi:hypothetical protein